jgi:hypothetical protein
VPDRKPDSDVLDVPPVGPAVVVAPVARQVASSPRTAAFIPPARSPAARNGTRVWAIGLAVVVILAITGAGGWWIYIEQPAEIVQRETAAALKARAQEQASQDKARQHELSRPAAEIAPVLTSPTVSQTNVASPAQTSKAASLPPPAGGSEPLPLQGTYRVTATTSLRILPDDSSKSLALLKVGEDVTALAKSLAGDWYRIRIKEGSEGYVSATALVDTTALEEAQWQRVSAQPSAANVEAFLEQFPNGLYNAEARRKLEVLRKSSDTAKVSTDQPPAVNTTGGGTSTARCSSILDHSQLGEPISDADRVFLAKNCR